MDSSGRVRNNRHLDKGTPESKPMNNFNWKDAGAELSKKYRQSNPEPAHHSMVAQSVWLKFKMVGAGGFEPPTPAV
jgi:hypothetical protein